MTVEELRLLESESNSLRALINHLYIKLLISSVIPEYCLHERIRWIK